MRYLLAAAALTAGLTAAGCGDGGPASRYVKPTIAVMDFENRAPFPLGWDLGGGTRDVLVDRLCETGRFQVVERPELDAVLQEIRFQQSGATRDNDRAKTGRLKNVRYLIKGTVTDFGHVSTSTGFWSGFQWDVLGGGHRAVMSMTLYVVDVESGEIICSETVEESVRTKEVAVKAHYGDVAFGGTAFYRTPLGKATRKVIGRAVDRITESIADQPWRPKIALVQDGAVVIINGGTNRRIRTGWEYDVMDEGEPIFDPDTGDRIGVQPGRIIARVCVFRVRDRYCVADVVRGDVEQLAVGQHCRRVLADPEEPESLSESPTAVSRR